MHLRYIELFHAILTTGSLTGAAKLLNVSQPAASKALQHAEARLGFALFSRVRGRLQPTQQALLLQPRIENIIHDVHDLERLTRTLGQPESYPLRVTATPTLAFAFLANAAVLLRKTFPDTATELATRHSIGMQKSLTLHETDIGLTLQENLGQNLHREKLCQGRIMVIAPPGWWPEDQLSKPLPIDALAGQSMIGITTSDELGGMLQGRVAQLEPAPRTTIWVQTYQLAYALVAKGEGLALVDPFTACGHTGTNVQTRPLKLRMKVSLYAVYRADDPLNQVQRHFLKLVSELARQILPGN